MANDRLMPKKRQKFKTRTKFLVPNKPTNPGERLRRRFRIVRQVFFVTLLIALTSVFLYNNRDYILSSGEDIETAGVPPKKDGASAAKSVVKQATDAPPKPVKPKSADKDSIKAAEKAAAEKAKAEKAAAERVRVEKQAEAEKAALVKKAAEDSIKAAKKAEVERAKAEKRAADIEAKIAQNMAYDSIMAAQKAEADKIRREKHAAKIKAALARIAEEDSIKAAQGAGSDNALAAKEERSVPAKAKTVKRVEEVLGGREFVKAKAKTDPDPPTFTVTKAVSAKASEPVAAKKEATPPKQQAADKPVVTKTPDPPTFSVNKPSDPVAAKKDAAPKSAVVEVSVVTKPADPVATKKEAPSPKQQASDNPVVTKTPDPPTFSVNKPSDPVATKKEAPSPKQQVADKPIVTKSIDPVAAKKEAPVAVKKEPPPKAEEPAPPKFSPVSSAESILLSDVKCRLADRANLDVSVTAELFFEGSALRREIMFKRGALETLTMSVVRKHGSAQVTPATLGTHLLTAYNGALESGRISRVDVKNLNVEVTGR